MTQLERITESLRLIEEACDLMDAAAEASRTGDIRTAQKLMDSGDERFDQAVAVTKATTRFN